MDERGHESVPDIRLDAEGRVAAFGPGAEALFGCRAVHAVGRPLVDVAAEALLRARKRSDAAVKELDRLAYAISHDMRAPLRHLDGFVHLLEDELKEGLSDDARHFLRIIAQSSQRMSALLEAMLQLARIGTAPFHPQPVDMKALVEEVVGEAMRGARGREIRWEIGDLPHATADRTLLREAWTRLVDNALKFTRQRSPAEIAIGALPQQTYFIRDNGAGFESHHAEKLFVPFQRLHPVRDFEGIGIGLAIVRRVVERHEGRAWAEGRTGEGASFFFSLPEA